MILMIFNFLPLIHKYKKIKKIVEERYRARERERERIAKATIHTRAPRVPGNGANDMPGSLVNGTFREFSDGFVELGIPRTGSSPFLSDLHVSRTGLTP